MRVSKMTHIVWFMIDYRDWFRSVAKRRITADDVAEVLEMSRATATRRLTEDKLTADEIIKLCRQLGAEPVMALVDLDRLTVAEVFEFMDSDGTLLTNATPEQLLYHLAKDGLSRDAKLQLAQEVFGDELEQIRKKSKLRVVPLTYDGTVTEFDHTQPHAADSSMSEQEEREKRGEDPID